MHHILFSSINSTAYDYAGNCDRLIELIKLAEANAKKSSADIHVISALPLTGPTAQAYNSFLNTEQDEAVLLNILKELAKRGASADSELTTLISFPWYHRDPSKSVDHPFYYDATNKMNNRPFYATAIIQKGKIVKIHLESHLEYKDGGPYDDRYFAKWPMDTFDTITLDDEDIPVGTFSVNGHAIAATPTQAKHFCAAHPDTKKIILNSSGCYHSEDIQHLSQSSPFQDCTILSGNPLGTDSGDKIGSGEVFVYRNGAKIYHTPEQDKYAFSQSITHIIPADEELFTIVSDDPLRIQNDVLRASALWMRDYLLKTKQQGFVISMSDGMNSAYTLMVANRSIEMAITACGGIEAYLDARSFGHLSCKNDVLVCLKTNGEAHAIRLLKNKLLTCVYMPDSSEASRAEQHRMKELVETTGGFFQVSEIGPILTTNIDALDEGLKQTDDQRKLHDILRAPDVLKAAAERAQVTVAGIVGNMENKICVSNTSATAVAYGRLHAGGAGQEGPISVTLSLFQTQISDFLKGIARHSKEDLRKTLQAVIDSSPSETQPNGISNEELIIELMILQRMSPIETYRYLLDREFSRWHHDELLLLKAIDEACSVWSISQPSRVALSVSPHLGSYGKNLDRYRSVRNTRDNQYFNNGRVELKLQFLHMNTPYIVMIATCDPALRDYILNTEHAALNKDTCDRLIADYEAKNQVVMREIMATNEQEPIASRDCFDLHVGVASLHQTMFDYSRNSTNIKNAIQDAERAGLDVFLLPELSLTGYFGDGDFDWIKTREEGDKIVEQAMNIAQYAKSSPLIISMGLPIFIEPYAKPFVGQALLHRGKIISISLKSIQPDGEAEYEAMHFSGFDIDKMGTTFNISIPGQIEQIPVGKPVVIVTDKHGNQVPICHEQCAEAWPGVNSDGTVNEALQREQRYINKLARKHPGLLVLNPSGSKNDVSYPKTLVRKFLLGDSALAHNPNISGYLYVNVAGDDNGTVGADADGYIIGKDKNGRPISHQSMRHTLAARNFSSMVISIAKAEPQTADVTIHQPSLVFNALQCIGKTHGAPARFDLAIDTLDTKTREYSEITYATSAWILNSLRHHKKQCFVISLSGGADSTLGAVQIIAAVDLFIKEHAEKAAKSGLDYEAAERDAIIALFKETFAHLKCKNDVLAIMQHSGAPQALKHLKNYILVCVYMPTANSSKDTLLSAKTLIEGGPRYKLDESGRLIKPLQKIEGADVEGLGGRFLVSDLQKPMEAYILSYTGKQDNFHKLLHDPKSIAALNCQRQDWPAELSEISDPEKIFEKIVVLFSEKRLYDKREYAKRRAEGGASLYVFPPDLAGLFRQAPPTWWEKSHDLAKQNLQPRLRSICPWLLAELYDGVPLFTSNLSEAAAGYSTWAGDTSLGYENGLGGIPKSDVRRMLLMYEQGRLCGLEAKPSLFYVNNLEPSAELRPLDEDGVYTQTDEADLMPYTNLDRIIFVMILGKRSPWQTFQTLRNAVDHKGNSLFKDDEERALQIHKVCWLFQASQFKRTGGGNTPFLGGNLDPHLSQATTLISQYFLNGRVEMNLRYLAEQEGTAFNQALYYKAILDIELRQIVATTTPMSKIRSAIERWESSQVPSHAPAISIFSQRMPVTVPNPSEPSLKP